MAEHEAPPNPPFYTDEELDAMYQRDPVEAMRISRRQVMMLKELEAMRATGSDAPAPEREKIVEVLEKARQVLLRDGGDLELVDIQGSVVRIRLKGNCAGCPRATLDLKNVVERTIRQHFPQVTKVENTF